MWVLKHILGGAPRNTTSVVDWLRSKLASIQNAQVCRYLLIVFGAGSFRDRNLTGVHFFAVSSVHQIFNPIFLGRPSIVETLLTSK